MTPPVTALQPVRGLGLVVHHWFRTSGHLGQFCSAWPPAEPRRTEWDGTLVQWWLREERLLDAAGCHFEILAHAYRFEDCLSAHVEALTMIAGRAAGIQIAPESFPLGNPGSPRAAGELVGRLLASLPRVACVDGRAVVHLWALPQIPQEERVTDWLLAFREAVGCPIYLVVHRFWRRYPGWDEVAPIYGAHRYFEEVEVRELVRNGRACAVRPGFYHASKPEAPFLPRHGGEPYRMAWREVLSYLPERIYAVWNEIAEGSQLHPSLAVRHPLPEYPYPSWPTCAEQRQPSVGVVRGDWWGRGRRRYLRITRRYVRRWTRAMKEAA